MKNTNNTTEMKAPSLTFKKSVPTSAGRVDIELQLADDCYNGHADFSITGTVWERAKNGRLVDVAGGCIHEEILKAWPEAAQFVALHLSDYNGAPMYAAGNGFYHMHDESKTPAERLYIASEHFRTTPENLDKLFTAEDEDHLRFMLEDLGIVEKWKEDAKAAISKLEELTGEKWDYTYVWPKSQYNPLTKDKKEALLKRISEGYYTPEAQAARNEVARLAKIEAKRKRIEDRRKSIIDEANKGADVELWLLKKTEELKKENPNFIFDMDMSIFYSHSDTIGFNWGLFRERFTKGNFDLLVSSITPEDRAEWPCNLKFELK